MCCGDFCSGCFLSLSLIHIFSFSYQLNAFVNYRFVCSIKFILVAFKLAGGEQHFMLFADGKSTRDSRFSGARGSVSYTHLDVYKRQPVPMLRMVDVELTSVDWLWFPYIPFGKLTIIQGNPGEGKTYFAMRLAAACTNRKPLPGMETLEPSCRRTKHH